MIHTMHRFCFVVGAYSCTSAEGKQVAQCLTKAMSHEISHVPTPSCLLGIPDILPVEIASIAARSAELQSSNDNLPFKFTRIHPSSECEQWTARP